MTEPSGTGPTRRPRRQRTVFAPDEVVHLSELSLALGDYTAFSAGSCMANLHSTGVIHGDLHGRQLLFSHLTGVTTVLDWEEASLPGVDPDRMFQDIIMLRMTMGDSWFRGFLAGYVRTSFMVIDPKHPGFTDALLARAGGRIGSVAKPARPVFTDADCDVLLAPVLDLSSGSPRLTADVSGGAMSADDLTTVRCALLLAGVEGAQQLLGGRPAEGVVGRLFGALAKQPHRTDLAGTLEPSPAALQVLSAGTSTDPAYLRCLAGMSDVYDWLALRLDRSGTPSEAAFSNSVRATVLSITMLRDRSWTVSELESQELKVTSRHRHLSWYASTLQASPSDERYPQMLPYLVFRYGLYERMFGESPLTPGDVSRRLWSANWRAMSLSRTALRNFLSALRAGTSKVSSQVAAAQMGEMLAINNARAVRDNLAAVYGNLVALKALDGPKATLRGGSSLSQGCMQLAEELEKAKEIFAMFMTGRTDLVRLAASEQVCAVISRSARLAGDDFDRMVARSIEPDF